jgi:hypothetical protein
MILNVNSNLVVGEIPLLENYPSKARSKLVKLEVCQTDSELCPDHFHGRLCHPGILNKDPTGRIFRGGRLSIVDLLVRIGKKRKKVNNVFNFKSSLSILISTRRSTVLSISLQLVFPAPNY